MTKRLIFLLLALLLPGVCAAQEIPERPRSYVEDRAGMLSRPAVETLESELTAFEKRTTNQIVVLIIPGLQGASIEDLSVRLAQSWGIGTKKNDNGVLLLIAREDRAVRIEVGYGLEGALPDAICKRIIEREIVPAFKKGDFDGGVTAAVHAIISAVAGEYQAKPTADEWTEKHKELLFFLLVFYMILPYVAYLAVLFLMTTAFGPWGFAAGVFIVMLMEILRRNFFSGPAQTFSRGGWHSGSRGGWSGGGFSGGGFSGGGGSFGGGGASGRW